MYVGVPEKLPLIVFAPELIANPPLMFVFPLELQVTRAAASPPNVPGYGPVALPLTLTDNLNCWWPPGPHGSMLPLPFPVMSSLPMICGTTDPRLTDRPI